MTPASFRLYVGTGHLSSSVGYPSYGCENILDDDFSPSSILFAVLFARYTHEFPAGCVWCDTPGTSNPTSDLLHSPNTHASTPSGVASSHLCGTQPSSPPTFTRCSHTRAPTEPPRQATATSAPSPDGIGGGAPARFTSRTLARETASPNLFLPPLRPPLPRSLPRRPPPDLLPGSGSANEADIESLGTIVCSSTSALSGTLGPRISLSNSLRLAAWPLSHCPLRIHDMSSDRCAPSNVVARHVPDPSSVSHATSASGSYPDWNSMGGTLLSAVSPVSSEISSRNPIPSDDASNVSDHDAVNPRQMPSPPTVMRPRGPSGLSGSELPRLVASAAASSSSIPSSSDASSASDAPLGVLVHADAVRPKATACAFSLNREAHLYPSGGIGERRR